LRGGTGDVPASNFHPDSVVVREALLVVFQPAKVFVSFSGKRVSASSRDLLLPIFLVILELAKIVRFASDLSTAFTGALYRDR
jgi:hypothetical protein